jgi:hypothetical protein
MPGDRVVGGLRLPACAGGVASQPGHQTVARQLADRLAKGDRPYAPILASAMWLEQGVAGEHRAACLPVSS